MVVVMEVEVEESTSGCSSFTNDAGGDDPTAAGDDDPPLSPLEDTIDSMEGLGEGATKINCLGADCCCCFTRFKAAEGLDSKIEKMIKYYLVYNLIIIEKNKKNRN